MAASDPREKLEGGWLLSQRPWMGGRWYISHPIHGEPPGYLTREQVLDGHQWYLENMKQCDRCGQSYTYKSRYHKCPGQWEQECAEAGVAPLVDPYAGMTWVEEQMAKQGTRAKKP